MTIGLRESPPFTTIVIGDPDPEDAHEYRSTPGRGVSAKRRIDVSSNFDLNIEFFRLKPASGGLERVQLWEVVLDGGVPLVWPVPDSATYDDVLVRIWYSMPSDPGQTGVIHIGDHWSTT